MSQMKRFLDDVDFLINDEQLPVSEVARIMNCTEEMVLDTICILRDAYEETIQ